MPWPNGEPGGSLPGENDHVEAGELCDSLGTGCGGLVMVLRWLIISPFKSFILNPADDCVHKRAIFTSTNLDHPFGSICLWGHFLRQVDTLFLSRQQPVPSDGKFLVGALGVQHKSPLNVIWLVGRPV